MKPWRCDPYLWVHLAGLATVPLWIDLCLLGLAVGNPTWPGLELGFIVAVGVLPVLVMQLRRPFYIFSLPGLALRPRALAEDQRRLLTQFRRWRVRLGALLVPVPLVWALVKLYPLAFLAHDITPFGDWGRWGGVAIAALGFFLANLFLQVPVAVLQVLATPDRRMQQVLPYAVDQIAADFTLLGLPVGKILPAIAFPEAGFPASPAPKSVAEGLPQAEPRRHRITVQPVQPTGKAVVLDDKPALDDGAHAHGSTIAFPAAIDISVGNPRVDAHDAAYPGIAHHLEENDLAELDPEGDDLVGNHLGDDVVQPHPEMDESAMAQALIPDGAIAPEYPATACGEAVPMPTAEVPGMPVDAFTQNI